MWKRLKNYFFSLETYGDLSPDVRLRRQVEQRLKTRPNLNFGEWFETFWRSLNIEPAIAHFVYVQFPIYSGLSFACVVPSDKLDVDLYWTDVCWFDWEMCLFEDFQNAFHQDISGSFDLAKLETIEDLMKFLNSQIPSVKSN